MKNQYIDGPLLMKMFVNAANTLDNNREAIDSLNVFPVPDGDTGTNMSLTMFSAVEELNRLKEVTVGSVAEAVASGSLMGARGNSGVILSQLFRGFAAKLKNLRNVDTVQFAHALAEGVDTAYKAVMKPTEGTILTVARETAEKAVRISSEVKDFNKFIEEILLQSTSTLEKTSQMLKVLAQAGVVDAGGKGFVYILLGLLKTLKGEDIKLNGKNRLTAVATEELDEELYLEYPYCTEFIIKNPKGTPEQLKELLSGLGDSTLVVGDGRVIKVHIHTDRPNKVMEEGLRLGELSRIKIENMKEQHRSIIEDEIKEEQKAKDYGIISVSMGDGFSNLFKDLGVDVVIHGGQTMNPSTQDIVKAVDSLNAENIIVLPNNSNIILAANQARELSSKNVYVVPSKTIPQGISAMVAFNSMQSAEDNFREMTEALERVKTGQVTYAVRDSVFDGIEIKEGDIIGIGEGKIKNKGDNISDVAFELVKTLIDDDSEVITVFYGQEVDEDDAYSLEERISEEYKDCDVEVHYGGQPVYYYVFAVE
ncbi:MAG: Dihydroxyacetone kinase family protein [Firmicutes bacterium]|nr:Dihydroxyacetone kinase family protein [Bacillota bacterium]MDI6705486.1 DAK2 domain-containing protein [Bacillota bacterium]